MSSETAVASKRQLKSIVAMLTKLIQRSHVSECTEPYLIEDALFNRVYSYSLLLLLLLLVLVLARKN